MYTLSKPTPCEQYVADHILLSKKQTTFWKQFPSGEQYVRLLHIEKRALVIGRTWGKPGNLWGTLLLLDTLKRNGIGDTTLVLPYFAYARQDRQRLSGEPLSGVCIAQLLACAGANRILTLDLHSERVQKASPIPVKSISFLEPLARALQEHLKGISDFTVIAPDKGARKKAYAFARALKHEKQCAWIEKERDPYTGMLKERGLHGSRKNTTAILVDDMLDTGGTICESVHFLKKHGFKKFYLCITHPLFSNNALTRISSLGFKRIFVSDTIPLRKKIARFPILQIVPSGPALVKAISTVQLPRK